MKCDKYFDKGSRNAVGTPGGKSFYPEQEKIKFFPMEIIVKLNPEGGVEDNQMRMGARPQNHSPQPSVSNCFRNQSAAYSNLFT